jgi:hypothetical protein
MNLLPVVSLIRAPSSESFITRYWGLFEDRPPGWESDGSRIRVRSELCDEAVVLDRRERVVEAVKQPAPLLVARRLAEALRVVFEPLPRDEQEIAVRRLDAPLQL